MSIQGAMHFLQAVREDPAVRSLVQARRDELQLEDLVSMGAALGWAFSLADLAQAFRHDWTLRALKGVKAGAG